MFPFSGESDTDGKRCRDFMVSLKESLETVQSTLMLSLPSPKRSSIAGCSGAHMCHSWQQKPANTSFDTKVKTVKSCEWQTNTYTCTLYEEEKQVITHILQMMYM